MNMPAIEEFHFTALVPIVVCALFIILYGITVKSEFLKEFLYGERPTEPEEFSYFLFTKYAGVIILGIIPVFVFNKMLPHYSLSDYGVRFSNGASPISFYWILVLGPIIILANLFIARRRKASSLCQEIILKKWDAKRIGVYSIAYSLYLFAFELLFRGFLFFPQVNSMGVLSAISINVLIYTLSQTPKGVNDTIGQLVFGLVLCIATFQTGTIWVALIVQILSTVSFNLFAAFFRPEMRVVSESR